MHKQRIFKSICPIHAGFNICHMCTTFFFFTNFVFSFPKSFQNRLKMSKSFRVCEYQVAIPPPAIFSTVQGQFDDYDDHDDGGGGGDRNQR